MEITLRDILDNLTNHLVDQAFDLLNTMKDTEYKHQYSLNEWGDLHLAFVSEYTKNGAYEKAIEFCDYMQGIAQQLNHESKELLYFRIHNSQALCYNEISKSQDAILVGLTSYEIAQQLEDDNCISTAAGNLAMFYDSIGKVEEAFKYYTITIEASKRCNNLSTLANAYTNIGSQYIDISDFFSALQYCELAHDIYMEMGSRLDISRIIGHIGIIYFNMNDMIRAKEYFEKAYQESVAIRFKKGSAIWAGNLGNVYAELKEYDNAMNYYEIAIQSYKDMNIESGIALWKGNIADVLVDKQEWEKAGKEYQEAIEMLTAMEKLEFATHFRGQYAKLLIKPNYPSIPFQEIEQYIKDTLTAAQSMGMKKDMYENYHTLSTLYEINGMWEQSLLNYKEYISLREEIQNREAEEKGRNLDFKRKLQEAEKDRSLQLARLQEKEQLLHEILPSHIAEKIVNGEKIIAESKENVSILFCDISGFTEICNRISPESTLKSLSDIYTAFDTIAQQYSIDKIKTIGDCYMATYGLQDGTEQNHENILRFALELLEESRNHSFEDGTPLEIRIGMHAGKVMAGVIGDKKLSFDIWGDAVNIASRMESTGEKQKIHVADTFLELMSTNVLFQSLMITKREPIFIKGKGMMNTYLISSH